MYEGAEEYEKQVAEELEALNKTNNDSEELNNFLYRVNEIESIIGGLSSRDKQVSDNALKRADFYLHDAAKSKTIDVESCNLQDKTNRTVINQAAFDELGKPEPDPSTMSQEAFMKSVEADAKQRAENRRQRKEIAERHKLEGNKAFRNKDYEKALACYNMAIAAIKDSALLYTNRALTCLKLNLNQRALEDADRAIRLNEHTVKGVVYKAEALYNLGRFQQSKTTIEEACENRPEKATFFKEAQQVWLSTTVDN